MKEIKFNDLKTIGYSFKVSTNKVENNYTVVDYKDDVNYPDYDLSGVQIVLSKNNADKKMFIFYKHDFIKWSRDKKFKITERLLDNEYIKVLF